jgi:hypothetical protein
MCYVYPADVEAGGELFSKSRWFTLGWSLQELLAPRHLELFEIKSWRYLIQSIPKMRITPEHALFAFKLKHDSNISRILIGGVFPYFFISISSSMAG